MVHSEKVKTAIANACSKATYMRLNDTSSWLRIDNTDPDEMIALAHDENVSYSPDCSITIDLNNVNPREVQFMRLEHFTIPEDELV